MIFNVNRQKTLDEEFKVVLKVAKSLKNVRKMDIDCRKYEIKGHFDFFLNERK